MAACEGNRLEAGDMDELFLNHVVEALFTPSRVR